MALHATLDVAALGCSSAHQGSVADSGSVEGGPQDGGADAHDGGPADAPSDAAAACPQGFFDLDDFNPDVAHTLVVRLDADLQILDFVHLMSEPCRHAHCGTLLCHLPCLTEEDARETTGEVVDLSADVELLRGHLERDVYVFLDAPDPDGQVAVLTSATPFQVAFASTLSTDGPAMLQWPPAEDWRDPEALGLGCEPTDHGAQGFALVDGSRLEPEVARPVFKAVTATGAWRFFRSADLNTRTVLRYPPRVADDGGTPRAAWIVVMTGYFNVFT